MQCPRCGATAPDTMSRCGRCDSPLQAATAGHEPAAAPVYDDGPPPIQQAPLGASIYEGGGGPPVQAFVESAEDSWHPLGQGQHFMPSPPPSTTSATTPSAPPGNEPFAPFSQHTSPQHTSPQQTSPPAQPRDDIGEPPGEATQMWTPPPAFGDLPGT